MTGLTTLVILAGCAGLIGEAPDPVPPSEVRALNEQGEITVVDVREPDQYAEGHIPGAMNIPFDSLEGRLDEVPDDKRVIFVCQGGPLSRRALQNARDQGVEDANNMAGGMSAWEDAGYELEP
jgi:rhodanese-related sulfurtransferase